MSRKATTRHGVLKWFSFEKHYGFIRLEDPEEDALLHENRLEGVDRALLVKGAIMDCECATTGQGVNVQKINSIAAGDPAKASVPPDGDWVSLRVKWYNEDKGYGFLTVGDGAPDVFVHATIVKSGPLEKLVPDQVVLAIIEGSGTKQKAVAVKGR